MSRAYLRPVPLQALETARAKLCPIERSPQRHGRLVATERGAVQVSIEAQPASVVGVHAPSFPPGFDFGLRVVAVEAGGCGGTCSRGCRVRSPLPLPSPVQPLDRMYRPPIRSSPTGRVTPAHSLSPRRPPRASRTTAASAPAPSPAVADRTPRTGSARRTTAARLGWAITSHLEGPGSSRRRGMRRALVSRDLAWLRARRRLTAERPGGHPVDLLSKWALESR